MVSKGRYKKPGAEMYKNLGRLRAKIDVHLCVCADFSGVR